MKVASISSSLLTDEGRRMGPRAYVDGSIAARKQLQILPHDRLSNVTAGFKGGIFTHLFSPKRTYVSSPQYGVPFLGASSMLLADLSRLPLISKKNAESRSYRSLAIREGMTLISCSGSVGRMVYARSDMDGMISAGDILKVQPDPKTILPGFLYAFLSSRYGQLLVNSGVYGTIVQHLEPQHIADLPVPRLGDNIAVRAHELVETAATSRTKALKLLTRAIEDVQDLLGNGQFIRYERKVWSSVPATRLQKRCDAYYFSDQCERARRAFNTALVNHHRRFGDVAEVFIPGIFKRRYADDPQFGVPYITGGDVFQLAPKSERYLMRRVADENRLRVEKGTVLIQEAGQLGGLIGRSVMVGEHLDGFAVSNNMVRVKANEKRDAGFLFALFSTQEGITLVAREAAGSSIPHMDASRLRDLRLPWPEDEKRHAVSDIVDEAIALRDFAVRSEDEARALVEHAVEDAT